MFAIIDQTISRRRWHLLKFWSSLPIPFIYLIFNIIYWAAKGTNRDGEDWVYPVLKWGENPGGAVLTMVMVTFALPVIHMAFWCITKGRDRLHRKIWGKQTWDVGIDNGGLEVA